jgi:pimeloyl-ACP methyl ester carboxylesterase
MSEAGPEFAESFIAADGFRIRCLTAGAGDAILCLHGAGGLRLTRTHALLAAHIRVIALELPGFGASAVNERSRTLADLAGTCAEALAALGLGRAVVMGHGLGASVALWLALGHKDIVRSLVLSAPDAIRLGPAAPEPAPAEARMAALHAHPERHKPPPAVTETERALVRRLKGPPRDPELEAKLPGLALPVLALFGTGDRISPPDAAYLYREKMPNCHVVMIYDAAHALEADRPEAVAALIADFIAREERFLVKTTSALIHP